MGLWNFLKNNFYLRFFREKPKTMSHVTSNNTFVMDVVRPIANIFLDQYNGDDFTNIGKKGLIWSYNVFGMPKNNDYWEETFPLIVEEQYKRMNQSTK